MTKVCNLSFRAFSCNSSIVCLSLQQILITIDMTEQIAIQELLMSGNANVQLSVSGKDLREFGESLIRQTVNQMSSEKKEIMLKIKETAERLGVDRSTLYRWEQSGYLKPVRLGGVPRYRLSDIEAIMNK